MSLPLEIFRSAVLAKGNFVIRDSPLTEIQLTVIAAVGVAVSATAQVWGSNDGAGKVDLGTLIVSGTVSGVAPSLVFPTISDSIQRNYQKIAVDLTAISGAGAVAVVTI